MLANVWCQWHRPCYSYCLFVWYWYIVQKTYSRLQWNNYQHQKTDNMNMIKHLNKLIIKMYDFKIVTHHFISYSCVRVQTVSMSSHYKYRRGELRVIQFIIRILSGMSMDRSHPEIHILKSTHCRISTPWLQKKKEYFQSVNMVRLKFIYIHKK